MMAKGLMSLNTRWNLMISHQSSRTTIKIKASIQKKESNKELILQKQIKARKKELAPESTEIWQRYKDQDCTQLSRLHTLAQEESTSMLMINL
jgi:membrane protein insertase Oxa1/YidC/SpoIIIJ